MIGNFQNVYLKASKIQIMSCKDGPDFGPKKLEFQYQVTLPVFTLTPDKIQNFSIQIKYEM